jgi:hypothetical protein
MNEKTTVIILYMIVIVPMTLTFLHLYLPWAGKNISNIIIRLFSTQIGSFACFFPLILIDNKFEMMYIFLYASAVAILTSTFVTTLIKLNYPSSSELESFLKKEGFYFHLQKYSLYFYNKKEISTKDFLLTLVLMIPYPSIIWNNFNWHIIIYLIFVSFLPIYGLIIYWAKKYENT